MAGYWNNLLTAAMNRPLEPVKPVDPMQEQGVSGTAIWGGYIEETEKDRRVARGMRYETATDILANISMVAAGLRYFLNLTSAPVWKYEPAKDMADGKSSDAAKQAAEFAQSVMEDMETNWSRVVRRSALFRFHGFGIHEWTAKRRDSDGRIGLQDIEPRPCHTIEKWGVDDSGGILAVEQRSPQNGALLTIPRQKFVYYVDDALTDSPEGMGLFRHLVDPSERLKRYLQLEGIGYDRDLRGVPVGRAPLAEINAAVKAGAIKPADRDAMLVGIRKFLRMSAKSLDTSALLDSSTYNGTTADGITVSGNQKWGVELINSQGSGFEDIGKSIERVVQDIAIILGSEGLLLGGTSGGGNRALGEDKSRNLYISVNQCTADMAQAVRRDALMAVWLLNGLPMALMPAIKPEDASFKDAASVAATLRDMATAGAVLEPDDPAIDDVRDLLGVSRRPADSVQRAIDAALMEHEQAATATESADVGLQQSKKDLNTPTPKPGAPK